MATVFLVCVVVLVVAALVFGIVSLLTGDDPGLAPAEPDGRALPLPNHRPLAEADLEAVRFDVGAARLPDGPGRPGAAPHRVRHRVQGRDDRACSRRR